MLVRSERTESEKGLHVNETDSKAILQKKAKTLKGAVISGVLWKSFENFGIQFINFGVSIILARLLTPNDFGTIALLTIFIQIASILMSSGFPTALVQKENTDQLDRCSVFYFSIGIGLVLYALLWLSAPAIASFYHIPVLKPIMRVLAFRIVLGSLSAIQNVELARNMLFRKSFMITIPAILTKAATGIALALSGYGLWSLVWAEMAGGFISTGMKWIVIGWRPSLVFSAQRLRSLFSFGSKLMGANFVTVIASQLHSLVIGRVYSAADLGFYNRGDHLPEISMRAVEGGVETVLFPAFSKLQNDRQKLKLALRRTIRTTTSLIFPLLFGIASVAEPFVRLLLSDKWLPSVPYVRLACLIYVFTPLGSANLQAVKAIGQGGAILKIQIAKRTLAILMVFATYRFGVLCMAAGRLAIAPFELMLNIHPNTKYLGYTLGELLSDIIPNLALAAFMAFCSYAVSLAISLPDFGMLLLQTTVGLSIYLGLGFLLRLQGILELRSIFKR